MADGTKWREEIQVGFQVFATEGGEEFGAVRDVCPAGRDELLVYVENSGEECIPLSAVEAVHDEKVIVDLDRLAPETRSSIQHAHEAEARGL